MARPILLDFRPPIPQSAPEWRRLRKIGALVMVVAVHLRHVGRELPVIHFEQRQHHVKIPRHQARPYMARVF